MTKRSRIADLASTIQDNVSEIDAYLAGHGIQSPTFNIDAPRRLPQELTPMVEAVVEAADELSALVQGPLISLLTLLTVQYNALTSLHAICHFDVAQNVSKNGGSTFVKAAEACGLEEQTLTHLLRHAMTYRIFREPIDGQIQHTAASTLLAEMPSLRHLVALTCVNFLPSAASMVQGLIKWPGSEEPNQCGFNIGKQTNERFAPFVLTQPNGIEQLAGLSLYHRLHNNYDVPTILEDYDWVNAGDQHGGDILVVDIAFNGITIGHELVEKFPSIRCVIQHRPGTTGHNPDGKTDRLSFMEHDIFSEQPIKGAEVYHFSAIFPNWSDKYALRILKALIPALRTGTKILITVEGLPDPGTLPTCLERRKRSLDLTMKAIQNGKLRDTVEWQWLFQAVDGRLRLETIINCNAATSIVVGIWNDEAADVT